MRLERYLKKPKKIVRNVLLAIVSIVAFNFLIICELIVCSNTSFCDFFTRNKTSALKSIPKTAERNIIVDTCGVCLNGGVKVLSENIINGIAKKKPNWHFSIISPKGSKHPFNLNIPNAHTIYVLQTNNRTNSYRSRHNQFPIFWIIQGPNYPTFVF